uniref:LIM zinc-binding domain-containing protein n=1 Tax=Periophthalmus magnuspinnatus TaxID=409849 RepID=A0A3B4BI34_9GOBI
MMVSTYTPASAAMDQSTCSLCVYSPITCGGCGGHIQDRFFLLAAGRAWHSVCLCCSVCHCELQTQPSLFWRDGAPYCHLHYCRGCVMGTRRTL